VHEPSMVSRDYGSWINQVLNDDRHVGTLENSYHDFHVLMRFVGYPIAERTYRIFQLVMAILVATVVWRGRRQGWSKTRQLRAAFDLGSCWIILFGPATENSTYALLAPTMALAAWESHQDGQPAWRRWWLTGTVSLFVLSIVVTATPLGKSAAFYMMPLGALLLFAERLVTYCRRGREPGLENTQNGDSMSDGSTLPICPRNCCREQFAART
jgi:hypothetical protein